jgi:hypothetical protein
MPKQRKTRQEKISTQIKRQQSQFSYSFSPVSKTVTFQTHEQKNAYAYVSSDVRKTFIISASLICLQIILFFLLQHHVVKIPGVTY